MATVRKFMFDRNFDEISVTEEPPEEEPEDLTEEEEEPEEDVPTFGEEDLAQAREEGIAAGREQGIAEATEATERRIAETLDAIARELETLLEDRKSTAEQASREAMTAGVAVVRKLFPALNRDHGRGEIANERSFAGEISVAADSAIADSDCAVEWSDGGAFRDTDRMWREVDDVINRNLKTDAEPEPAHSDIQAEASADADADANVSAETDGDPSEPNADAGEAGRGDADG